jgi:hypothetical protein
VRLTAGQARQVGGPSSAHGLGHGRQAEAAQPRHRGLAALPLGGTAGRRKLEFLWRRSRVCHAQPGRPVLGAWWVSMMNIGRGPIACWVSGAEPAACICAPMSLPRTSTGWHGERDTAAAYPHTHTQPPSHPHTDATPQTTPPPRWCGAAGRAPPRLPWCHSFLDGPVAVLLGLELAAQVLAALDAHGRARVEVTERHLAEAELLAAGVLL